MTVELTTRWLSVPALVALVAVCLAIVIVLYRREAARLSRAGGVAVVGLRVAFVAAACLLLADPAIVRRGRMVVPGEVLVVVDTSRSFALVDRTRPDWQKVREARALGLLPPGAGAVESERGAPEAVPGDPSHGTADEDAARRAAESADGRVAGTEDARAAVAEVESSSRLQLVTKALESGWLRALLARHRVSILALDGELRPVAALAPGDDPRAAVRAIPAASGSETRLDLPFRGDLLRGEGAGVSGLILLTDGNHRGPGDPAEAAGRWARSGVPAVAVGVGALEPPPDLSVEAIDATGAVFAGDEVEAEVSIRSTGLPAAGVTVSVRADGGTEPVAEVRASIPEGTGVTKVPVRFPAGEAGRRRFTVSVPPGPGDATAENNRRDLWIAVRDGRARVLYLDAGPRWEQIYLKAAWSRDDRVDLRACLLTPPPLRRLPPEFPRGREELFGFDVLVLGDVEPSLFAPDEIASIRDFVTGRGGSLVVVCGERAMPLAWAGTPLADLLPVWLLDPPPPRGAAAAAGRDGLGLVLTAAGERAELTRLVPGREETVELWRLLPGPFWVSPIAGVRPGAEALARVREDRAYRLPGVGLRAPPGDDPRDEGTRRLVEERSAVVVAGPAGAGRVLYVGMDSTWKWRRHFGDELFRRFWGQVVRWSVASRLEAADPHVRLGTDRVLYGSPATVRIEALIESSPGTPYEGSLAEARIVRKADGKEARLRLEPLPGSGGRFRAVGSLDELGLAGAGEDAGAGAGPGTGAGAGSGSGTPVEFLVRLEIEDLPGYSELPGRAEAPFVVEPEPRREDLDLAVDAASLRRWAEAAGGVYLPFWRHREADGRLRDAALEREVVSTTRLWGRPWALLLVLVGLPVAEWILRKRGELV